MCAAPARPASLAAAALAWGLLAAGPAVAQTMYKWIDESGKVQYSDRAPKGFKGEVTRIEADIAPTVVPSARKAAPAPKAAEEPAAVPADDMNSRRKANRERLEARLERARANLERAKKALAEAPGPDVDERQVIQQRVKGGAGGNMGAMAPRSNCRNVVDAGGAKSVVCPAVLPGTAYYDRIAGLEETVRRAEADLEDAEIAYRRGRD
jgi:hypothetical protein